MPQCGSYTTEINAAVNRMLRATDPVDYMRQEMTQPLSECLEFKSFSR